MKWRWRRIIRSGGDPRRVVLQDLDAPFARDKS